MNSRVRKMRDKARVLLDKSAAILSGSKVTDAQASIAGSYQNEAKEIIDRAENLMAVLDAGKDLDAGNGTVEVNKMGSKDKGGFEGFGSFLKAVKETKEGYRDERLVKGSKALAEGAGVTGGYMVPAGFLAEVFAVDQNFALIEPRARVIEMSGRSLSMPALDQTGVAVGKPHFFGSLDIQWTEEAGEKPVAEPAFKQIELVPHKLAGYCEVSDELIEDSNPTINSYLTDLFGEALSWFKDDAYIAGDGVGKPLGIIGAAGTFTQVRAVAANVGYIDIVNMISHYVGRGGVWLAHQSCMPEILTMVDPGNNYIWHAPVAPGMPGQLLGMPILWNDHCSTLGATGDLLLCDLSKYLIGKRKGITVDVSTDYKFRTDQTAFRFYCRVDGQEGNQSTIVLADGATIVSPFVELDAATS